MSDRRHQSHRHHQQHHHHHRHHRGHTQQQQQQRPHSRHQHQLDPFPDDQHSRTPTIIHESERLIAGSSQQSQIRSVKVTPESVRQYNNNKSSTNTAKSKLNTMVVKHLYQLELRNKKLEQEKANLENQLIHLMKRFAIDNPDVFPEDQLICHGAQESDGVVGRVERGGGGVGSPHETAPLACYESVCSKYSLLESSSTFSLPNYSSLSDVYEDICLNRNPVHYINGSNYSEQFDESDGDHDRVNNNNRFNIDDQVRMIENRLMALQKKSISSSSDSLSSSSPSSFSTSSSSSSSSSSLSSPINHKPRLKTTHKSIHRHQHHTSMESLYQPNSLPISPVRPIFKHLKRMYKDEKQGDRPHKQSFIINNPWIHQSDIIASEQNLTETMNCLYDLKTDADLKQSSPIDFHQQPKKQHSLHMDYGPPKIHITRKQIIPRQDLPDYSDDTSTTTNTMNTTPSSTSMINLKQFNQSKSTNYYFKQSATNISSIQTYLTCVHQFFNLKIQIPNSELLKHLNKLIKHLNVYSCISGCSYILQTIKPDIICSDHTTARMTTSMMTTTQKPTDPDRNSSDLGSEWSNSNFVLLTNNNNSNNNNINNNNRDEENTAFNQNIHPITNYESLPKSITTRSITTNQQDSIIHQGYLFKLNKRLKIWHQYWCVLTLNGLFLHEARKDNIHYAKHFILLISIGKINCPKQLSKPTTTITTTTGNTTNANKVVSLHATTTNTTNTQQNSSAPVTRKNFLSQIKNQEKVYRSYLTQFELCLNTTDQPHHPHHHHHHRRNYQLRGLTIQDTIQWIHKLKQSLRVKKAEQLYEKYKCQLIKEGWLKRIKGGQILWLWCRLMNCYIIYFINPVERLPVGYKYLQNANIQIDQYNLKKFIIELNLKSFIPIKSTVGDMDCLIGSSTDSDSILIEQTDVLTEQMKRPTFTDPHQPLQTIKIISNTHSTIYFVCNEQNEFQQWYDSLLWACVWSKVKYQFDLFKSIHNLDQFKLIWAKLVRPTYTESHYHTDQSIKQALSQSNYNQMNQCIEDPVLEQISLQMFDYLLFLSHPQLLINDNVELPLGNLLKSSYWFNVKYRIFEKIANICDMYPQLKDEFYLQLMKQILFVGIDLKIGSKDAFVLVFKPKPLRRGLGLICTKSQSDIDCTHLDQTELDAKLIKLNKKWSPSLCLNQLISQLGEMTQITMPMIVNRSNQINSDQWWPAVVIWECMSLFLSRMLPSEQVLLCLECLLHYCQDSTRSALQQVAISTPTECAEYGDRTKSGKFNFLIETARYASFCSDTLNRTKMFGGREQIISILEIATVSIRNPYLHVYPFSLPIYLPFGSAYEVISFHGGSIIQDIITQMIEKLGFQHPDLEIVAQFSVYLNADNKQHIYLHKDWKICDIISIYEQYILNSNAKNERISIESVSIKLIFKIQTFAWNKLKQNLKFHPSHIRFMNFLIHQLHSNILSGNYQIQMRRIEFIDLVSYMCRANHYDYVELQKRREHTFTELVHQYFPSNWSRNGQEDKNSDADSRLIIQMKLIVLERWTQINKLPIRVSSFPHLIGHNVDLEKDENRFSIATLHACLGYLRLLKNVSPHQFSASAFVGRVINLPNINSTELIWIIPQADQIQILTRNAAQQTVSKSVQKLQSIKTINYTAIVSYGAQKSGTFFLVYIELQTGRSVAHRDQTISDRSQSDYLKGLKKLHFVFDNLHDLLDLSDTLHFLINDGKEKSTV